MEGENSPHSSLCVVRAEELFPKLPLEKDDDALTVSLNELAGEFVRFLGPTEDGVLAISNYRLYLHTAASGAEISVPLGLIESAIGRDLNQLIISCKDASTVKCSFDTFERCAEWQRRITLHIGVPPNLETLFAFPFYAWSAENKALDTEWAMRMQRAPKLDEDFEKERVRLKFRLDTEGGPWRVSKVNVDFKLCASYPRQLLVPACLDDATLHNIATFRSSRRIPAVVWRHRGSGAILARCSQPELGWLGWRNHNDEAMLKAFVDACAADRAEILRARGIREQPHSPEPESAAAADAAVAATPPAVLDATSEVDGVAPADLAAVAAEAPAIPAHRKLLIIDARSYTSAVTNRARGGGCECTEYYPYADIEFMSLGNIHTIRKSFHQLRQLCASPPDNASWLSSLERCLWLQHLAVLLSAAVTVCRTIELCGRPVLVHCSDGWDRTPQILATAQLCMDPHYRTVEGFRQLVEREWLGFGHKFADRCGHGPGSEDVNERCPVFLQWLDAVHQIHRQFPCSFEFSAGYLIKLAQHSHSCIFGTFLCNTLKDRMDNALFERTFSVWGFLSEPIYRNPLYVPNRERVLWPQHNVRDLVLWSDVYLGSLGNQSVGAVAAAAAAAAGVSAADVARAESVEAVSVTGQLAAGEEQSSGGVSVNVVAVSADGSAAGGGGGGGALGAAGQLNKTRSYDDLLVAGAQNGQLPRRSSDPNMTAEVHYDVRLPSDPSMDALAGEHGRSSDSNGNGGSDYPDDRPSSNGGGHSHPPNAAAATAPLLIQPSPSITAACSSTSRALDDMTADLQRCDPAAILGRRPSGDEGLGDSEDCAGRRRSNGANGANGTKRRFEDMDGGDVVDGGPNGQLSGLMQSVNLGDVQQSLAAEHNQSLSSVDANCSDALFSGSHSRQGQRNGSAAAGQHTADAIEAVEVASAHRQPATIATASQQPSAQYPCDNCASVVDGLPVELRSSVGAGNGNGNSNSHQSHHSHPYSSAARHSTGVSLPHQATSMDESIMIQPEFQRMDITNGGQIMLGGHQQLHQAAGSRREFSAAGRTYSMPTTGSSAGSSAASSASSTSSCAGNGSTQAAAASAGAVSSNGGGSSNGSVSPPPPPFAHHRHHQQHLQQQHSQHSQHQQQQQHQHQQATQSNGRYQQQQQPAGLRSLPLTPPASYAHDRPAVAISCPDGLAHALSEQNLRLQQIVQEHRIREEALQRELYSTRLALVRKIPPCLMNQHIAEDSDDMLNDDDDFRVGHSDEESSIGRCRSQSPPWSAMWRRASYSGGSVNAMLDNAENASICSWEAVEEQRGYAINGGGGGSSNGSTHLSGSVLWVPDHAVSQCTSCQTEFWLGRRKHHCRSCGQIFCADCSEFWAALPDERLYQPVRLCGPCYHNVTTKTQMLVMQQHKALKTKESTTTTTTNNISSVASISASWSPPSSTAVSSNPATADNNNTTSSGPSSRPIYQQQQQQTQSMFAGQPSHMSYAEATASAIAATVSQPSADAVAPQPPPGTVRSSGNLLRQPSDTAASSCASLQQPILAATAQSAALPTSTAGSGLALGKYGSAAATQATALVAIQLAAHQKLQQHQQQSTSNEPCKHAAAGCCGTATHDPSALKTPTATN